MLTRLPVHVTACTLFRPSFTFNKASKRDAEEQRILARHLEEKQDREEARQTAYASRERVEQGFREAEKSSTSRFGFNRGGSNNEAESSSAPKTGRAKWEQGGRYQFEASNSDDELEAELDDNLDEIAGLSSRLKILASTAGKEIDAQNKHLDKVSNKVDNLDDKILMNTQYLKRSKSRFPLCFSSMSASSVKVLDVTLTLESACLACQ